MTDKKETWKKFMIICRKCGRHEDEGVHAKQGYDGDTTIKCPCGQIETY